MRMIVTPQAVRRRRGGIAARVVKCVLTTASVVYAAIVMAGCSKPSEADPRTDPPMVITTIAAPADKSARQFSGVIAARVQSNLGFRVNGKIIQRLVDVGQEVVLGQPLMKIDPVDLNLAIAMKKAELNAANARAVQAITEESRQEGLVKTGATTQQVYDDAKAAAATARAQVDLAEAALRTAENLGEYATLYADADGIVVDTLAEPGHVVAAGETVIKLAHAGAREASVYLPETVRPEIGSIAIAKLYGGQRSFIARLRQLSNAADPVTRTFEARYVLDGKYADTPLGATVAVQINGKSDTVSLPIGAITDRGSGPGVWILAKDPPAVTFRPVQISKMGAEDVQLKGGVKVGETVVALGAHLLNEGQQVQVAKKEGAIDE
jgi:RND family efflux transporter MFP subunit